MVQSLQKKFVVIIFLSIIVFMSGIGYWIVRRESTLMYEEIRRKGTLLAETLAIPMINDLIYEKLGLVEEGGLIDNYVTEIFEKQELQLLYIMVLDVDGRVISHNDFTEYGNVIDDETTLNSLRSGETEVSDYYDAGTGHGALDVSVPLSIGRKRWGTLKLGVSLEEMEEEKIAALRNVAMITFVALVAGLVWTIALSRRFIKPVTELAQTMEHAGIESLDVRARIEGSDELAMLANNFNSMIERIRDANLEVKRTQEKLMQSEKLASLGVLASGIAHEINNPLGGMFNCVNMLRERGGDERFRGQYLDLLADGLERIEGTVGKLLWMSKRQSDERAALVISRVIHEVMEFIEYRTIREGIRIAAEIDESLIVRMERHDLHQVLLNLIINSIQALDGMGGIIEISARRMDGRIIIGVRDTGKGISREDIGRVFDPFYTTKSPGEGTGLGLWMTYEIIKNYGGGIDVESEPGKGATFSIILNEDDKGDVQNPYN